MYTPPTHSTTIPPIELGQILRGRYRLEALIGLGSSGAVYRALDLKTHRTWAIKLMRAVSEVDGLAWHRFVNEGAIISQLCHPNIVAVREFDLDAAGRPFLVMEYLQGEDLLSLLERRIRLPVEEALDIAQQVGSALSTAHAMEIVHRDIKPNNIFVLSSGRRLSPAKDSAKRSLVKVFDFGIAKTTGLVSPQQTAHGVIVGTPQYMAPECTRGSQNRLDPRADQWSLAVVLYRMLAGCLPFHDADLAKLILKIRQDEPARLQLHTPGLPEHVGAAVHRALSKSPEDRFPTIQDFLRALHGIRQMQPRLPSAESPSAASGQLALQPPTPKDSSLRPTPRPTSGPAPAATSSATTSPPTRRRTVPFFAAVGLSLTVLLSGAVPLQRSQQQSAATAGSVAAPRSRTQTPNLCTASADAAKPGSAQPTPPATTKVRPTREVPFPPLRLAGPAGRS
jgi:serine/threonine protein kinase